VKHENRRRQNYASRVINQVVICRRVTYVNPRLHLTAELDGMTKYPREQEI
jgi:hypothetical protein